MTYGQFRADTWRVFDQRSADDDRAISRSSRASFLLCAARRQNPLQEDWVRSRWRKRWVARASTSTALVLKARGWIEKLDTGQCHYRGRHRQSHEP